MDDPFEIKRVAYVFLIVGAAGFDIDRDIGTCKRVDEATLFSGLHQTLDRILARDRQALSLWFEESVRPQGNPCNWAKGVYLDYLNSMMEGALGLKIRRDQDGYGLFDELAGLLGGPGQPPHPGWPRVPATTTAA